MPREEKVKAIKEIKDKIDKSNVVILSDYSGMTVKQMTELRKMLQKEEANYVVVKNSLALRALSNDHKEKFEEFLKGPVAMTFGAADPVAPAKILAKFIKQTSKPLIKCGIVEGRFINEKDFKSLAKIPSREELIAKAVGSIKAPLYGLVNVLSGPIRKLAYALEAIKNKKGQG